MDESTKNRVIIILGILVVLFFVLFIGSCGNAVKFKKAHDKEMEGRLDVEEKMSKFTQEKSSLEKKLNAVTQSLEEEKTGSTATKKALLQEQLVNQSLKDELQKVTKLKETLEEDLKEALLNNKAKSKK